MWIKSLNLNIFYHEVIPEGLMLALTAFWVGAKYRKISGASIGTDRKTVEIQIFLVICVFPTGSHSKGGRSMSTRRTGTLAVRRAFG